MKLVIKNIRQHRLKNIEIQNTGTTILKGLSGAGKSTILDSIYEALYGGAGNITNWEQNSSEIILEAFGLTIIRKKGPTSLKVTHNGIEYIDEAAQGVINATIGMSEEEFLASSYIQQSLEGGLLLLSPAEQLRFIQRLAFGKDDPEVYRTRIAKKISESTSDLKIQESLLISKQKELLSMQEDLLNYPEIKEPLKPEIEEDSKYWLEILNNKKAEATEVKAKIVNINYLLGSTTLQELGVIKSGIDSLSQTLNTLSSQAEEHKNNLGSRPEPNSFEENKKTILLQKEFLAWEEKARSLRNLIIEKYKSDSSLSATDILAKKTAEILESKRQIEDQLQAHRAEIAKLSIEEHPKDCPVCGEALTLKDGKLIKHQNTNAAEKKKVLQEAIEGLATQLSSVRKEEIDCAEFNSKVKEIKATAKKAVLKEMSMENLNKMDEEIKSQEKKYLESVAVFTEKERAIAQLEEKIKQINKQKIIEEEKYKKKHLEASKSSMTVEELSASKKELEDSLSSLDIEITSAMSKWEMAATYEKQMSQFAVLSDRRMFKLDQIRAKESEIEECQGAVKLATKRLESCVKLKEISDRAAVESIEAILNSINYNAKLYIDKMFPNTGTSVVLQNKKTLDSGDERAKMSVRIFHKGSEVKKLKELSGGERSRLALAFQLAMSDMYSSPILLVDEGFKGLSKADLEECLPMLKEASENKAVIVVEHHAPDSFFDNHLEIQ
jgi:DNA repair exonuclease SbcCD ATPase subunit